MDDNNMNNSMQNNMNNSMQNNMNNSMQNNMNNSMQNNMNNSMQNNMNNGMQNNMNNNQYNGMSNNGYQPNNMVQPNQSPKKNKKLYIIIGVVAILIILYFIGSSSNKNESSNGNNSSTNTNNSANTNTNTNTNTSTNSNSNMNLKDNVVINGIENDYKKLYLFVKNNNSETVRVDIKVIFYDESGNVIDYKPPFGDPTIFQLGSGQEVIETSYDYAPENHASYKVEYDVVKTNNIDYYDKIEIVSHERIPDNQTLATKIVAKNNSDKKLDRTVFAVAYYNKGKFVGVGTATNTSFDVGATITEKALHPTDRNSSPIPYDDYKIYVDAYTFDAYTSY